jgi:hypothetical protein
LWTVWSVEVRVLSGAWRENPTYGVRTLELQSGVNAERVGAAGESTIASYSAPHRLCLCIDTDGANPVGRPHERYCGRLTNGSWTAASSGLVLAVEEHSA